MGSNRVRMVLGCTAVVLLIVAVLSTLPKNRHDPEAAAASRYEGVIWSPKWRDRDRPTRRLEDPRSRLALTKDDSSSKDGDANKVPAVKIDLTREIAAAQKMMDSVFLGEEYPVRDGRQITPLIRDTRPYYEYQVNVRGFGLDATREEVEQYYCGGCRQYLAIVPNAGAHVGHYMANWMAGYAMALSHNLTFIHHNIQPNQAEKDVMDFFMGSSLGEKYFYDDICVSTAPHNQLCRQFLPCLKVYHIQPDTNVLPGAPHARPFKELMRDHGHECNVVFHEPTQPIGTSVLAVQPFLAAKYLLARRKYPIAHPYPQGVINVALHIRRGDIVTKPGFDATSRFTHTVTYKRVIEQIENVARLVSEQGVQVPPISYHLFSQGTPEDFAELARLPNMHLHLDEDLLYTLHLLVTADIMVCARSGMSDMVAQLRSSTNPTFFPSGYWAERQPTWIKFINNSGEFDAARFEERLRILLQARESGTDFASLHKINDLKSYL